MLLIFDGKYPSFDKVSDNLDQYLTKCIKKLVELVAETAKEVEVVDCEKFEKKIVLQIVMQRVKSIECLVHLANFGKEFYHSITRDVYDAVTGIFGYFDELHKNYYGQTVDFVTSKLDVIFTGEKATRKFIRDVLVPRILHIFQLWTFFV